MKKVVKIKRVFDEEKRLVYKKEGLKEYAYKYDKNGNLIYKKEDCIEETFKYDNENRLIYRNYVSEFNKEEKREEWTTITKDENNNTIFLIKRTSGKEIKKIVNDKGKLIYLLYDDIYECYHDYDDRGNEIYYKIVDLDEKLVLAEDYSVYDSKNNLIDFKSEEFGVIVADQFTRYLYNEDGSMFAHTTAKDCNYEYWEEFDKNKNLISYKNSDGVGSTYKYDNNNNMIYHSSGSYERVLSYNDNGDLISSKDTNGEDITYIYEDEFL